MNEFSKMIVFLSVYAGILVVAIAFKIYSRIKAGKYLRNHEYMFEHSKRSMKVGVDRKINKYARRELVKAE